MAILYYESKVSCSHPGLIASAKVTGEAIPEPCKMKECRCKKNQFCEVCGAGRVVYPCICDKYQEVLPNE